MIQYKKIKLFNPLKLKRKLPNNYKEEDKKYFFKELEKSYAEVNYFKIKKLTISGDGTPINSDLFLLKHYLAFSSLSGFVSLKKFFLIFKHILNIFFKTLSIPKKKYIKNIIFLHDRNSIGYFHWINDILPKIILSEKFKNFKIIIPSNLNFYFHKKFLKFYEKKILILNKEYNYEISNVILIPELSPSGNPRPKNLLEIKKKFNFLKLNPKKKSQKIYISRYFAKRRFVINEKELVEFLKKKNFKIYYFEKITTEKQIQLIHNSNIVLSFYGAALANIIWMKKNSNVVELKPKNEIYTNCFFAYANILRLNYYYLLCKKKNFLKSTKNSDYYVDIKKLNNILKLIDEKKK